MVFKIIALDIDGTLTNSQKHITSRTLSQLIKYQKNGGRIILASGRPTHGIRPYAEQLRLREFGGYILSYNGGCIIDCASNALMFHSVFPNELIPDICEAIRPYPVGITTYQGDTAVIGQQLNAYAKFEARVNRMSIRFVEDFAEYVQFEITKCMLHGEPEVIADLEVLLSQRFGDRLDIFRSEPFFLEIVPKEIDKAKSIDRLLHRIGLHADECIAFGDGFNDISMIRSAGLGVAMGNASEPVRQAADYIARSNDEDGIACLLQEMGRSVFPSLAML